MPQPNKMTRPKNPVNPDSEPNDRVKFHLLLTVYSVDRFTIDFKDLKADERTSFQNIVLPK